MIEIYCSPYVWHFSVLLRVSCGGKERKVNVMLGEWKSGKDVYKLRTETALK